MRARTHDDRGLVVRIITVLCQRRGNDIGHGFSFGMGIGTRDQLHRTTAAPRWSRRRVSHRAGRDVLGSWKTRADVVIDPVNNFRARAKIALQLQCLQPQCPQAVIARTHEQADFSLAKAIDRLHRITHHKQRAAIIGLPAMR